MIYILSILNLDQGGPLPTKGHRYHAHFQWIRKGHPVDCHLRRAVGGAGHLFCRVGDTAQMNLVIICSNHLKV